MFNTQQRLRNSIHLGNCRDKSAQSPYADLIYRRKVAGDSESTEMGEHGDSKSFWKDFKEFWAERFHLNDYSKILNPEKPLPHWDSSVVEEFIASDPVHGPTLKKAREAGTFGAVLLEQLQQLHLLISGQKVFMVPHLRLYLEALLVPHSELKLLTTGTSFTDRTQWLHRLNSSSGCRKGHELSTESFNAFKKLPF